MKQTAEFVMSLTCGIVEDDRAAGFRKFGVEERGAQFRQRGAAQLAHALRVATLTAAGLLAFAVRGRRVAVSPVAGRASRCSGAGPPCGCAAPSRSRRARR